MRNLTLLAFLYGLSALLFQAARTYGGFGLWFLGTATVFLALYETLAFFSLRRDFTVARHLSSERVRAGETITVTLNIEILERRILPIQWLRVEDALPSKLVLRTDRSQHMVFPWRKRVATVQYTLVSVPRGVFRWEGVRVSGGDMFGLLHRNAFASAASQLVVYPVTRMISHWPSLTSTRLGNRVAHSYTSDDSVRIVGTREYIPGDRLSRIHWRASARAGALRSKEFEQYVANEVVFILDASQSSYGSDPGSFETALSVSGSLAEHAYRCGHAFGFYAFAKVPIELPIRKGETALLKMLEFLAMAEADGAEPLSEVVARLMAVPRQTTVVFVTRAVFANLLTFAVIAGQRQLRVELFVVRVQSGVAAADEETAAEQLQAFGWRVHRVRSLEELDVVEPGRTGRAFRA